MNLTELRRLGFTNSLHVPFTKQYRVRCTSCEALVICGIPCHETGCPEAVHECAGCNELIPTTRHYCGSCS